MTVRPSSLPRTNGALAPAAGFIAVGFLALALVGLVLWQQPHELLRAETGAALWSFFALLLIGWLGSVLFGLGYHVVPMLAGLPWRSRVLPWVHLTLHLGALVWACGVVIGWIPGGLAGPGTLGFAGVALFVLNQQLTAGRLSLWEPANITFAHALFWLVITAGLWGALGLGAAERFSRADSSAVAGLVLRLGALGVLVMGLLGLALKLVPMFLVSRKRPAALAWLGGLVYSAGLYLMTAAQLGRLDHWMPAAHLCIGLGTTFYLLEILRLAWGGRRAWGWDLTLVAMGLLLLAAWVVWTFSGRALGALTPTVSWWHLALVLLGPCSFLLVGLAARLVPLLAWTRTYAPRVGQSPVPTVESLGQPAAWVPLMLVLLLAFGYLVAGLALTEKTGVVFAGACYLLSVPLFAVGVSPALRTLLPRRRGGRFGSALARSQDRTTPRPGASTVPGPATVR